MPPNNDEEHSKFFPVNQLFHATKLTKRLQIRNENREVFILIILILLFSGYQHIAVL